MKKIPIGVILLFAIVCTSLVILGICTGHTLWHSIKTLIASLFTTAVLVALTYAAVRFDSRRDDL